MYSDIKSNPPGMREKNDKTAMKIDKHNRKHQMAKKMKSGFGTPEHSMKKYKEFEAKEQMLDKKHPLRKEQRQEDLRRITGRGEYT